MDNLGKFILSFIAYCLKHIYGEDGMSILKELGVRSKEDNHRTASECFKDYGIINNMVVGR